MPTIPVVTFCTYRTLEAGAYSHDEHQAQKFVKALKGEQLKGWATVPVLGRNMRLDPSSANLAPSWFAELAVDALVRGELGAGAMTGRPWLIPVPDSDCVIGNAKVPRCFQVAHDVQVRTSGMRTHVTLRWVQQRSSTRKGGSRDAETLAQNLGWTPGAGPLVGDRAILIDDVKTTGGHLVACAKRLQLSGITTVAAVCAARTVMAPSAQPFERVVEYLEY